MGLIGWIVIIGAGLAWEAVAFRMGDTETWPTLTRVVREHAPKWFLAASLGWLVWHFLA